MSPRLDFGFVSLSAFICLGFYSMFFWGGRLALVRTQNQIFYFSFKTSNLSTFVGLLGFLWLAFNIRITWRPQPKRLVHFLSRKYQSWLTQMNSGIYIFCYPRNLNARTHPSRPLLAFSIWLSIFLKIFIFIFILN
jgi:hypothetical protein